MSARTHTGLDLLVPCLGRVLGADAFSQPTRPVFLKVVVASKGDHASLFDFASSLVHRA